MLNFFINVASLDFIKETTSREIEKWQKAFLIKLLHSEAFSNKNKLNLLF